MSMSLKEDWAAVVPTEVPAKECPGHASLEQLEKAAACYKDRQARLLHPDGTFDKQNRWYPSDKEKCSCCRSIRSPSVVYPWSLMRHCRSIEHVANLFGVDVKELRRVIRPRKKPEGPKTVWHRLRQTV